MVLFSQSGSVVEILSITEFTYKNLSVTKVHQVLRKHGTNCKFCPVSLFGTAKNTQSHFSPFYVSQSFPRSTDRVIRSPIPQYISFDRHTISNKSTFVWQKTLCLTKKIICLAKKHFTWKQSDWICLSQLSRTCRLSKCTTESICAICGYFHFSVCQFYLVNVPLHPPFSDHSACNALSLVLRNLQEETWKQTWGSSQVQFSHNLGPQR